MTNESIRAGLLGLGAMGVRHARVLGGLEGIEFVGAADPLGNPADCPRGVPLLPSLDALLELDIQMCVVAIPTEEHEKAGLRLADAGVATLIEKPLAVTWDEGLNLVNAFEAAGVVAATGLVERFNPALMNLKHRLGEGELGEIYQIATSRQGPLPDNVPSVGVVKDLATHDLDLTQWVVESEYQTLSAHTGSRSGRDREDFVAAVGRLDCGVIVNHLVNWMTPQKERRVVVNGERGVLAADLLTADLALYAHGYATMWDELATFRGAREGEIKRYALEKHEPLWMELCAFRDAVLGLPSEIASLSEGLNAIKLTDALLHSANTRTTVEVSGQEPAGECRQ
ncbi:Gfo/Idh/MocA family protein [Candidatus Poriferisocius sp.]|uniref:Gfo/Idh/MocA family protein n=1 Tax=Candidatus Poriferisocius sp. TaxID=3101276 RepID=UPI003B02B0AD